MKRISFSLIIVALAFSLNAQETGSFTDNRDGKTYKTVKIGNQVWMAENLAYETEQYVYWAHEDPRHYTEHGYFYNYEAACNVCPDGWRLPTKNDFEVLLNNSGKKSKERLRTLLKTGKGKKNGFNATLAGLRQENGKIQWINAYGHFWSSTLSREGKSAYYLTVLNVPLHRTAGMGGDLVDFNLEETGFSVRCIKVE